MGKFFEKGSIPFLEVAIGCAMGCASASLSPKCDKETKEAHDEEAHASTWSVTIEKNDTTVLGIGYNRSNAGLLIVSIFDNGAVSDWNRKNPSLEVLPGDSIVGVNGH